MKTIPMALAIPLAGLLAACGNTPDETASPTASPSATASTIVDPAPPAFMVCRSCHSTQAGQNGIGPTLAGVVGSKAGAVPGYNFSPALKGSGITWDRASLDTWLQGPMKMVPGTKMVLPVSDPAKRKAIIDYLETLK
ncbi:MAG TPA: c-type cytochrome [Novosphingobium sp.]|nr:c-type cytochrome [Novosphingobium sp.]